MRRKSVADVIFRKFPDCMVKKTFFKILSKVNKILLPSLSKLDVNKLTKTNKALIAYKYWVTLNVLE